MGPKHRDGGLQNRLRRLTRVQTLRDGPIASDQRRGLRLKRNQTLANR